MLLNIHNLPIGCQYSDVKELIKSKCGFKELILNDLKIEGNGMRVTIGVLEEGDAAILARKINGLFYKGQQLYIENTCQKNDSEQPYRPSPHLLAQPQQELDNQMFQQSMDVSQLLPYFNPMYFPQITPQNLQNPYTDFSAHQPQMQQPANEMLIAPHYNFGQIDFNQPNLVNHKSSNIFADSALPRDWSQSRVRKSRWDDGREKDDKCSPQVPHRPSWSHDKIEKTSRWSEYQDSRTSNKRRYEISNRQSEESRDIRNEHSPKPSRPGFGEHYGPPPSKKYLKDEKRTNYIHKLKKRAVLIIMYDIMTNLGLLSVLEQTNSLKSALRREILGRLYQLTGSDEKSPEELVKIYREKFDPKDDVHFYQTLKEDIASKELSVQDRVANQRLKLEESKSFKISVVKKVLQEEVDTIGQLIQNVFDSTHNKKVNSVYKLVDHEAIIEDCKQMMRFHVRKRAFNTGLKMVRVFGLPRLPPFADLQAFLRDYNCITFKKTPPNSRCVCTAFFHSYDDVDKLVAVGSTVVKHSTLTFRNKIYYKATPKTDLNHIRRQYIERLVDTSDVNILDKDWPTRLKEEKDRDTQNHKDGADTNIDEKPDEVLGEKSHLTADSTGKEELAAKKESQKINGDSENILPPTEQSQVNYDVNENHDDNDDLDIAWDDWSIAGDELDVSGEDNENSDREHNREDNDKIKAEDNNDNCEGNFAMSSVGDGGSDNSDDGCHDVMTADIDFNNVDEDDLEDY